MNFCVGILGQIFFWFSIRKSTGIICSYVFVKSDQWQILDLISEGNCFFHQLAFLLCNEYYVKTWPDLFISVSRLLWSETDGLLFSDVPLLKMLLHSFTFHFTITPTWHPSPSDITMPTAHNNLPLNTLWPFPLTVPHSTESHATFRCVSCAPECSQLEPV